MIETNAAFEAWLSEPEIEFVSLESMRAAGAARCAEGITYEHLDTAGAARLNTAVLAARS